MDEPQSHNLNPEPLLVINTRKVAGKENEREIERDGQTDTPGRSGMALPESGRCGPAQAAELKVRTGTHPDPLS